MLDAKIKGTDIARSLGVSKVLVSGVIHGRRKSQRIQEAISTALGKPISELWPDDNTNKPEAV